VMNLFTLNLVVAHAPALHLRNIVDEGLAWLHSFAKLHNLQDQQLI